MMTQKMTKDQVKKNFLILQKNNITEKVRYKNSITDQKKKKKKRKEKKKEIEHMNLFHPEDDKEKGRKFYEKMQKYA